MAEHSYQLEIDEMLKMTHSYIEKITYYWMQTFDEESCRDNLRRLNQHAQNFFGDLVSESLEKKSFIENEIRTLRLEAENLQRLLNTSVKLPEVAKDGNAPLLVVQQEMEKSLTDLREILRHRREQICGLLIEQEILCEELGKEQRPLLDDPLPNAEELDNFQNYLDSLKEERGRRLQDLMNLRREIKSDLKILERSVDTEAEDRLINYQQVPLTMETFDRLNKMREYYDKEVEQLKANIDNIRQKLPPLWDRLNTPKEERRVIERYSDYSQSTYDYLYMELERCEKIKRQNLQQYVQNIRSEIESWWDKTLKSEKQRNRFSVFTSDIYTDELLTLHEMELEDLKQYFETNQQIFQLYNDRRVLWERMTALEQKAGDPARYNNRGGQLLKEEKERKTIASKLPKIEQQIKELVFEYMERDHEPFLVYGEDIIEVMEAEWRKKREDKEALSTARKNAITTQTYGANRTQNVGSTRTPLMQRTVSTISLSKTPSSSTATNTTSKRTNFTSSAQKRKLKPSEKITPTAKRSLWNSPSRMFLKPTGTANPTAKQSKKMPRVLATTLRRRSGRLSNDGSFKKRRSINSVRTKAVHNVPKIVMNDALTTDDENYDVFKNSIEPDSRSSIRHDGSIISLHPKTAPKRTQQLSTINENKQNAIRLATLPRPQLIRTPSKQNLREFPISPRAGTTSKLTTKNLPIII